MDLFINLYGDNLNVSLNQYIDMISILWEDNMKIVTTPMCRKVVELGGISDYVVNKHPSSKDGDFAILLSESGTDIDSLPLKLNTFNEILESIIEVSNLTSKPLSKDEVIDKIRDYNLIYEWFTNTSKFSQLREENHNINVKVLSNFLKEIVEDMNFNIDDSDFDYLIYPDYMEDIEENSDYKLVKIPSHHNVPEDPIERAELRYSILLNIGLL